jgi:hypothetical protein
MVSSLKPILRETKEIKKKLILDMMSNFGIKTWND